MAYCNNVDIEKWKKGILKRYVWRICTRDLVWKMDEAKNCLNHGQITFSTAIVLSE